MKKLKKIPEFKNEDEEREFWWNHDSTEYLDLSKAKKVTFDNLKPTTKTISLRLPQHLLRRIREKANEKDIPYQSLIKLILAKSF